MRLPVSTIVQILKAVVPLVVDLVKPKKAPAPPEHGAGELGDQDMLIQLDAARNAGHEGKGPTGKYAPGQPRRSITRK